MPQKRNRTLFKNSKKRLARRKPIRKARKSSSGTLVNRVMGIKSLFPRRLITHAYSDTSGYFNSNPAVTINMNMGRTQTAYNMIINANNPNLPYSKANGSLQGDMDIFIMNGPAPTGSLNHLNLRPAYWSSLCGAGNQFYAQYRVLECSIMVKATPENSNDDMTVTIAPVSGQAATQFYPDPVTMGQSPMSKGPVLYKYYGGNPQWIKHSCTTSKVYGLSHTAIKDGPTFAGTAGNPGSQPQNPWYFQVKCATIQGTNFNVVAPPFIQVQVRYKVELFNPNEAQLSDV